MVGVGFTFDSGGGTDLEACAGNVNTSTIKSSVTPTMDFKAVEAAVERIMRFPFL